MLLREVLGDRDLSFNTSRARFLYIVEEHKLGVDFKKAGSFVFNIHHKIFENNYKINAVEKSLAVFVFQELYNFFVTNLTKKDEDFRIDLENEKKLELLHETDKKNIFFYLENKLPTNEKTCLKLDCYMKALKESKSKYGLPLYELIATDEIGEDITIYLWIEKENPAFHRKFSEITDFFSIGRKIRFFDLSWSEKGYFFQNEKTNFVIEPDFLLDVTSIAECFQNKSIVPELFFLKYLHGSEYNLAILKGGFVNHLLDAVISNPDLEQNDINQYLISTLRNQFLKVLDFTEHDFERLLSEVKDIHLKNLFHVAKFYQGKLLTLEPSFISEEFGIHGRLDAMVEYPEDIENKTIFELKSGKAPQQSLWQNHYAQVMGYNLLLKSVFQNKRRGTSSILYSSAVINPLRNVTPAETTFSQILMCRNIIVNKMYQITRFDLTSPQNTHCEEGQISQANTLPNILLILIKEKQYSSLLPHFLYNEVKTFLNFYNHLEEYEKSYLNITTAYILKEMIAQKTGYIDSSGIVRHGFSTLWNMSLQEKTKHKMILKSLSLNITENNSIENDDEALNYKNRLFTFHYKGENDLSGFREGDLLILYPAFIENMNEENENELEDKLIADPLRVPIFKAVLKKISAESLSVVFRNEILSKENLLKYKYFFAEKDMMESGYFSNIAGIFKFLCADKHKREIFFGIIPPRMNDYVLDEGISVYDRIMKKADRFEDYLLIQGPPGTGKTSKYLISIIKQHLNKNNSPIVILAFTNRAVEEICNKLLENELSFYLLGTNQTEADYHISNLGKMSTDNSPLTTHPKNVEEHLHIIKKKLSEKRIFVSTIANFQNEGVFLVKYIQTDLLIIDEASQLLENQLIGNINFFKKFILIGDHYQLPAVSTQNIATLPKNLTEIIGIQSLKESLFERLHRRCLERGWYHAFDLLPEHFRMHKDIADLVNHFYDNKLIPSIDRQFSDIKFQISGFENRTIFIPVTEKNLSHFNHEEALKIKELIITINESQKNYINNYSIGVICVWRLQVNYIKSLLSELPYCSMITVDTVERFQGSERDIIFYSTAISNQEQLKNLQSLTIDGKVDRKLNVAISRAKEFFILLGNREILSKSIHYKRVIDLIYEKNNSS
ncbi:MAG: AAA domain-containing protein [Candidatus Cloacimonetes bacterium]|nr:AAA domain-containing protein [Candidatus Cloacimonadota bacterium]